MIDYINHQSASVPSGKLKQIPGVLSQLEQRLTSVRVALIAGELLFWLLGLRRISRRFALSTVKSVLVVRLDEIGDVVLTSGFLRELRRNLPLAWITLVVKPVALNLVELCPYVDEILTFDCAVGQHHPQMVRHGRALKLAVTNLWRRRFDLALSPRHGEDQYHGNFLTYFSGARWRYGYSERDSSDVLLPAKPYFDRLLTCALPNNNNQHAVEDAFDVLRAIGAYIENDSLEVSLSVKDHELAEKISLECKAIGEEVIIGIAPGAREGKRIWPLESFVAFGKWFLEQQFSGYIVVFGGSQEETMGQVLQQQLGLRVINCVNRTTIRQSAALLSRCTVYVGNDTGLLHLSAAMKLPVVEISCHPRSGARMHVNSPNRFGPWKVASIVLQPRDPVAPCVDGCNATVSHCIKQVHVDDVKAAVLTLLAKSGQFVPAA